MARSPAPFARVVYCAAALALFAACGGVSDPFSPSSSAGTFSASGGSAHAGASNTSGSAGAGAGSGGSSAAGASSVAGSGASSAGSASQAGAGSSPNGGAGPSGGAANAGGAGPLADAGSDDGNDDDCQTLFANASKQLAAAQVCSVAADSDQCTGEVENTCHCQVAVHRVDSAETNAYLATLKQLQQKKCSQVCSAIACLPVTNSQCRPSSTSSASGMCSAGHSLPI